MDFFNTTSSARKPLRFVVIITRARDGFLVTVRISNVKLTEDSDTLVSLVTGGDNPMWLIRPGLDLKSTNL
ncbi:hypothetical protein RRG08_027178 [Elysia crispata]|uniref:Uncharacterized protein n=1 Tax=Elysia crispata TaxID=231223 RepID=A0AAE0Y058_9GAST|nr:hypothetical protein RRG08_027178 [Elysia crispata]